MERRSVNWLLAFALVVQGCALIPAGSALAPDLLLNVMAAQPVQPTVDAHLEGPGLRFRLRDYTGPDAPRLVVLGADGADWTPMLGPVSKDGDTYAAGLFVGTARLAVEAFHYTWILPGGRKVTGDFQFVNPRFQPLSWQVTRSQHFVLYHTDPLAGPADEWEDALRHVEAWTGLTPERPISVWIFPDMSVLNEWGDFCGQFERMRGAWDTNYRRLMVYHEPDRLNRMVVMVHETVHALSPGHGPRWFEEGVAKVIETRWVLENLGGYTNNWADMSDNLTQLSAEAERRSIHPSDSVSGGRPPMEPYTIGVSLWLFVQHYQGQDGIQRFLREGAEEGRTEAALEALFGRPIDEVWEDWNRYVRSPDLTKDWVRP